MKLVISGLLFLALAATATNADDTVLQILVGSDSDARFGEVIYLATGVELNGAGLTTRRGRDSVVDEASSLDWAAVTAEASRTGSDLFLLVSYEVGSETISIDFSLYRVQGEDLIATESLVSPIDIDLDSRVSAAIRRLIEDAGIAREQTDQTSIEGIELPASSDRRPVQTVIPENQPVPLVAGPELAFRTSGLLVVGSASEFFPYGVAGSLSGAYAPGLRSMGLSVGARAGVMKLFADTDVVGGELYVVTAAPEVMIGTPARAPAHIGLRAAVGAAVVMIVRPDETLAKTDLYMEAGVGARLPLGSLFGIGLEVNYLVVFESESLIMGFAPSLAVSVEP